MNTPSFIHAFASCPISRFDIEHGLGAALLPPSYLDPHCHARFVLIRAGFLRSHVGFFFFLPWMVSAKTDGVSDRVPPFVHGKPRAGSQVAHQGRAAGEGYGADRFHDFQLAGWASAFGEVWERRVFGHLVCGSDR